MKSNKHVYVTLSDLAFPMITIDSRPGKPRETGLTMVIDKGIGLRAAQDLVDTCGPFIDIVKFGWGTSRLIQETKLRQKIEILRSDNIDICLGGTFLEIAFDQEKVKEYLSYANNIGISMIEVSNGIHPNLFRREHKEGLIRMALDAGFKVVSEVGRKLRNEDEKLTAKDRICEIQSDIAAGAQKVICEARESGTVGIFESSGEINKELAMQLFQALDTNLIIWEAPKKSQQVWLLQNFGPNINLGNISVEDALSVETLRLGLRGDTVRDHQKGTFTVYIDVGVGGALRAKERGDMVVVVDALRASATIIFALASGASSVHPVLNVDECVGEVTAGERGGKKLPNVDYSNSPTELLNASLKGKKLILTTTNAIECLKAAGGLDNVVLVGSVVNASAVARVVRDLVKRTGRNVTLLAAGRNNVPVVEDIIGVSEIARRLDSYVLRGIYGLYNSTNLEADFLNSESGRNLVQLGYANDVIFCSKLDTYNIVPIFNGSFITI